MPKTNQQIIEEKDTIFEDHSDYVDREISEALAFQESKLKAQWRKEISGVIEYMEHDRECILSQFGADRSTGDGGYEQEFAGKWYQTSPIDKSPKCDCGLSDILKKL